MAQPTDEEIAQRLIGIISDGFNRSLGALEDAGAIDTTKMRKRYAGVGSELYELVTAQIELTARYGAPNVRALFSDSDSREKNA